MTFGVVEVSQIFEVIWVSLVAGVGITACFSFVILGTARYTDTDTHGGRKLAFGALAIIALLVFAGGLVFGVQVMLTKGN